MGVKLERVNPESKSVLRNMYAFYLHDLSAYTSSLDVDDEGTFVFDGFDLIWEREGLTPYFIKQDGRLAGFLLLVEPPFTKRSDCIINDFFLYNKYRKQGIGEQALRFLFDSKPGRYYVSQLENNQRAISFWKKVYSSLSVTYEERHEQHHGEHVVSQWFEIKCADPTN